MSDRKRNLPVYRRPAIGDVVRLDKDGVPFGVEPFAEVVAVRECSHDQYEGGFAVTLRVKPRAETYDKTISIAWIPALKVSP